jgi:hypothetical protein
MAAGLHNLLRQVANPQVHGLDKDQTFRVEQTAFGENGEPLRTISLNGNNGRFSSDNSMLSS